MHKIYRTLLTIVLLLNCNACTENSTPYDQNEKSPSVSIAVSDDPQAFDPRLVRNTQSVNIAHMLFEGLTRKNQGGKIVNGLADDITITDEGKTYTFHLRESVWSDGSPLTAHDFAYTIKSVLSPSFPSPNASQLYVIKGAKDVKTGKAPIETVGVRVVDDHTLVIELNKPTPYFLELTSAYFFMPVKESWAESETKGGESMPETIPTNGPFKIEKWSRNDQLSLEKNPTYWDANNVRLEHLNLVIVDESTALQMFERGQLDWIGSPISFIPPDAVATLRSQKRLVITPADGIHWFRLNTKQPLLKNKNFRKALAFSINRQLLCDHIAQGNQQPATGIVPMSYGLQNIPCFEDHNVTEAWSHYQEALKEEKLSPDELPKITILYPPNDRAQKIVQAVQQQWKEVLGIKVNLEVTDSAVFYERLNHQDYDIAIGSWYGDFRDPINFLDVFKYKDTRTNNTNWENPRFVELLDRSINSLDPYRRTILLSQAERVLVDDMPVIPLYYPTFNHLQQRVTGVYFSELGVIDFKHAYIVE
ncbi:MAG: peptide ABC transporter substrate-binding protein [Chlamydiota bacterium]